MGQAGRGVDQHATDKYPEKTEVLYECLTHRPQWFRREHEDHCQRHEEDCEPEDEPTQERAEGE